MDVLIDPAVLNQIMALPCNLLDQIYYLLDRLRRDPARVRPQLRGASGVAEFTIDGHVLSVRIDRDRDALEVLGVRPK